VSPNKDWKQCSWRKFWVKLKNRTKSNKQNVTSTFNVCFRSFIKVQKCYWFATSLILTKDKRFMISLKYTVEMMSINNKQKQSVFSIAFLTRMLLFITLYLTNAWVGIKLAIPECIRFHGFAIKLAWLWYARNHGVNAKYMSDWIVFTKFHMILLGKRWAWLLGNTDVTLSTFFFNL